MNRLQSLTFNGGRSTLKATPQRLIEILAERDNIKTPTVKAFRASVLRKQDKRVYPRFVEGQSTAEYVEAYWRLNGKAMGLVCDYNFRTGLSTPYPEEVQRMVNTYEPLSQAPQYSQDDTVIEESCE